MNPRTLLPEPASEPPQGLGVRQPSAAFPPATAVLEPIARAPESWRAPRRWSGSSWLSIAALLAACIVASAAELRLGQATVRPGAVVTLPVTCTGAPGTVAAQLDLSFDPAAVSLTGIAGGDALAGHVVDRQELAPGHWRAVVYSPTNGALVSSSLLQVTCAIPANAPDGVVVLAVSNGILSQVAGKRVQPLTQTAGALNISSAGVAMSVALTGGQLVTTITGPSGQVVKLQGTPDFVHWTDLGSYPNPTGILTLTNALPAGLDAYFYRVVVPFKE